MKRLLMLATILTILAVKVPQVSAAGTQTNAVVAQAAETQPATTQTVGRRKRTGFFARLWELEKRKNAAIRRMLGWE